MPRLWIWIALVCLTGLNASALASSRVALIIGNSDYQWSPLDNPKNDANDMANTLRNLGFDVDVQTDVRRVAMHRAIREFGKKLASAEIGLFYYAGHGVQVEGRNYLVPTDADIREEDEVAFETIDAARILEKMESAKNPVNIVILDACRNNPFASNSRTSTRGLARMDSPIGSLLLYATAPNMTAADGEGRNGVLTGNLIKHLSEPGLPLNEIILRTRVGVMQETSNQQVPWSASSLTRNVVLNQLASLDNSPVTVKDQSVTSASLTRVGKMMQICEKHYQANRLTSGAGGSALSCYQQVLELDPFNLQALEGIGNVADQYQARAENAIAAQRYASAERHLGNLRLVNPEHPAVEEIEYTLKRLMFPGAAPDPTPAPAVTGSGSNNADTITPVQTKPAQPDQSTEVATVAVSSQSLMPRPVITTPIPGLSINLQNAENKADFNDSSVAKPANTTGGISTIIRYADTGEEIPQQSGASRAGVQTQSPQIKLALAQPIDGQPYRLCPDCMQPASTAGQPCIRHEVLKGRFTPSTANACHSKVGGKCMDVLYQFRLSNVCQNDMYVEWAFKTFSGGTLVGKKKIPQGSTSDISCLNKEQDCKGQIRYAWDAVPR